MLDILIAVLAGFILNFMPCVLPVLGIKLWALMHQGDDAGSIHIHGLIYSVGCILTFVVIGLIFITASSLIPGWGSYMGNPVILGVLMVIFIVLGLASLDILKLPIDLDVIAAKVTMNLRGYALSLVSGILAPFVGSACLAPFMGVTIGAALKGSLALGLAIFASLGFGMALPFLIIGFFPKLLKCLPKTGMANIVLKYIIGGSILLTAVWLGYLMIQVLFI